MTEKGNEVMELRQEMEEMRVSKDKVIGKMVESMEE
jgi:hypothetical protein